MGVLHTPSGSFQPPMANIPHTLLPTLDRLGVSVSVSPLSTLTK